MHPPARISDVQVSKEMQDEIELMKFNNDDIIMVCPECDWAVSNLLLRLVKHNFGCPKCKTSFMEFVEHPTLTVIRVPVGKTLNKEM